MDEQGRVCVSAAHLISPDETILASTGDAKGEGPTGITGGAGSRAVATSDSNNIGVVLRSAACGGFGGGGGGLGGPVITVSAEDLTEANPSLLRGVINGEPSSLECIGVALHALRQSAAINTRFAFDVLRSGES